MGVQYVATLTTRWFDSIPMIHFRRYYCVKLGDADDKVSDTSGNSEHLPTNPSIHLFVCSLTQRRGSSCRLSVPQSRTWRENLSTEKLCRGLTT